MSQAVGGDAPIPEGDPDEWTQQERAALYEYVAELDISEAVTESLGGLAEALRRREDQ